MIYTPDELPSPNSLKQSLGSFFQNLFKPPAQENYQPTALKNQNYNPFPGAPMPYSLESYQVKPDDNDLSQVANNLNVPLQTLVDNNNGIKTLPPTGSYITVNPPAGTGSFVSGSGQVNTLTQGVPPNAALNQSYVSRPASVDDRPRNAGSYFAVQQMLASGVDPSIISPAVAAQMIDPNTGQPMTPQTFAALGYTQNPTTGMYEKRGVANTPTANAPTTPLSAAQGGDTAYARTKAAQYYAAQGTAFTEQMRWDPDRGRYVKIGQLIREGRLNVRDSQARLSKRRRVREEGVPPPPPEAANAPETSANVLQLRLGSG